MTRVLKVDPRRFYLWRARQMAGPSLREQRRLDLVEAIRVFHERSGRTYGSPRITADLRHAGWTVSENTVAKVMAEAGIVGISPRTFHPATTVHGEDRFPVPDLVKRDFDQGSKDQVWFSDITYLRTGQGWAYLCVVRDGHTRRVLGRKIEDHMRASLVQDTLAQAVALRGHLPHKVIFHADRGSQYTSTDLANATTNLPILRSMGRTGVCWDNAQAESFWSVFKTEFYERHAFATTAQARRASYIWIDSWYNAQRRHSALDYLSPLEYERRLLNPEETTN